jgi:8-oxo-dGTP diphosphatase
MNVLDQPTESPTTVVFPLSPQSAALPEAMLVAPAPPIAWVPNAMLAVDVVLFTLRRGPLADALRVLLVRQRDARGNDVWQLPGVLVRASESFEEAAKRSLWEKTGLDAANWYLEQLATYGAPSRDSRGRVASIAHVALVRSDDIILRPGTDVQATEWCPIMQLDQHVMAFDHAEMIRAGIKRIRSKLRYSWVAFQLLDERFTLPELRAVYAAILDPSLARLSSGNFKKAMRPLFDSGVLRIVGRRETGGRGRPSDLYEFVGPITGTRERELPW